MLEGLNTTSFLRVHSNSGGIHNVDPIFCADNLDELISKVDLVAVFGLKWDHGPNYKDSCMEFNSLIEGYEHVFGCKFKFKSSVYFDWLKPAGGEAMLWRRNIGVLTRSMACMF